MGEKQINSNDLSFTPELTGKVALPYQRPFFFTSGSQSVFLDEASAPETTVDP